MRVPYLMLGAILVAGCGSSAPQWPERELRVAVEAPNPCWKLRITGVFRRGDELLAVSELTPPEPGRMCAQVITTLVHRVTLRLPDDPVTHLVLGRDWDWGEPRAGYEFLSGRPELRERLSGAERLHVVGPGEGSTGDGPGTVE